MEVEGDAPVGRASAAGVPEVAVAPVGARSPSGKVATLVGAVLGLVALGFVVGTLVEQADEVRAAIANGSLGLLAVALVVAAASMTAIAVPWRHAIVLLGGRLGAADAVARYFAGEIGKYLPGSVWAVVGRGELARRAGVTPSAAYGSVGLSLLALYLAGLATATATLPAALGSDGDRRPWLLLVALPLGLLALHHGVTSRVVALAGRARGRALEVEVPRWGRVLSLVIRYVPAWLLIGTTTWLVVRALGGTSTWPEIAFAAALSWFAGFAAVPVPGGVGVREAVFVATAPSLDPGVAAAAALVARVLFVAVDAFGAVVASAWLARRTRRSAAEV